MDLWDDEIIAYSISTKRSDSVAYINGLYDVIKFKKLYLNQTMILIVIKGASIKSFDELSYLYNITCPMPSYVTSQYAYW